MNELKSTSDFNSRIFSTIKLKEEREETLSKSVQFLQNKQLFDPLIEAIRNTSLSCFNSIFQEEMDYLIEHDNDLEDEHSIFRRISMFSRNLVLILESIVENSRTEFVEKKQVKIEEAQNERISSTYDIDLHTKRISLGLNKSSELIRSQKQNMSKISIGRKLSQERIRRQTEKEQNQTGPVDQKDEFSKVSRNDQISIKVYPSTLTKSKHLRHSSIANSQLSNSPSSFYGSTGTRSPDSNK